MPILPPQYISTWYYLIDATGSIRLSENWSEKAIQETEKKPLLQGDVGTHVTNVGGIRWETDIDSPVLVIETNTTTDITSVFDLLVNSFNVVRNPALQNSSLTYILKSARIKIAQEGVSVSLTYYSSEPGAFVPRYGVDAPTPDFIARVARFYDTMFSINDSSVNGTYQILNGTINIDVDISENYFLNTFSQAPYFGVQGYRVDGTVELAVQPSDFQYFFVTAQEPANLITDNTQTSLAIGSITLQLGQNTIKKSMERNLKPGSITTVKTNFESYTRFSTPLT